MIRQITHRPLVLGVHPTSKGFGWAVFENPLCVHSHGVYSPRGNKNAGCLRKIEWLLKHLEPEVLVIEGFDVESSDRSERVRRLCLAIVSAAAEHDAEISVFHRAAVQATFAAAGAHTRDEVAKVIARSLPALESRLPKRRLPWVSEDKRLSVFSAAALVLTYFQNGATALLDDLRNAA